MKLLSRSLGMMFVMALAGASAVMAHEIWTTAENPVEGKPMVVIVGYGEGYPTPSDIDHDKLHIFNPLKVVDSKGHALPLKAGDKNYKAVTEQAVGKGSYMVLSGYKPTYWTKGPDGSVLKQKNEVPGAISCGRYAREAKGVVNIGGAADDFVTKPVGTKLEIVPLVNPGKVKAGQDFPLQVLYDGKPLAKAKIEGLIAGNKYIEEGNLDYVGETDKDGKFIFVPSKDGQWILMVEFKQPYHDKAVCDLESVDASLTFNIVH